MLKSNVIHSYPEHYLSLYGDFKDGSGTLRRWLNQVNKSSRQIGGAEDIHEMILEFHDRCWPDHFPEIDIVDTKHILITEAKWCQYFVRVTGLVPLWSEHHRGYLVRQGDFENFITKDCRNKFKGDMLEVLAEIFFNVFQTSESFGLAEYTPIDLLEDYGVDATGTNVRGHKSAVQVKYRDDPNSLIRYSDLARTFTSAICQLRLQDVAEHDHTVVLFTTAKGVTSSLAEVLGRKLNVVNRQRIAKHIDNNHNFWVKAYSMVSGSLTVT